MMNDLIRRALNPENCPELVGRWSGRGTKNDPEEWRAVYAGHDAQSAERAYRRNAAVVRQGAVEWLHRGVMKMSRASNAKKGR